MPQRTKEEKAEYWKEYSSKNRDVLREKNKQRRLQNLDEHRRRNRERMQKVYAIKREGTKEAKAQAAAQRKIESEKRKAERIALLPLKKAETAKRNHKMFPNRPRKRGDIRDDGMIFWRYDMQKANAQLVEDLEIWKTPEDYAPKAERERKAAWERMNQKTRKEMRDAQKAFRKKNPNWSKEYAKRRNQDPIHCMAHRCRANIQQVIRRRGWIKPCKTNEMLGCDWETLKIHIENLFLKGMSWNNRGKWHIDHYVPISTAKSPEDVIRLNHYTNLRPLWKRENLLKSDSLCHKGHQLPLLLSH